MIIRNNRLGPNRARGILLHNEDVLIEDNLFIGNSHSGIYANVEFFWNESGPCNNVIIRNNTFIETGNIQGHRQSLIFRSPYEWTAFIHSNILIENNTFINNFGPDIMDLERINGLRVLNNTVQNTVPGRAESIVQRNNTDVTISP
jgi:polygalacturonase